MAYFQLPKQFTKGCWNAFIYIRFQAVPDGMLESLITSIAPTPDPVPLKQGTTKYIGHKQSLDFVQQQGR